MAASETKNVKSGDVRIACCMVGDGSCDLVVTPRRLSHVQYVWEEPSLWPLERA